MNISYLVQRHTPNSSDIPTPHHRNKAWFDIEIYIFLNRFIILDLNNFFRISVKRSVKEERRYEIHKKR